MGRIEQQGIVIEDVELSLKTKWPKWFRLHLETFVCMLESGAQRYERRDQDGQLIGFIYFTRDGEQLRIHEACVNSKNPMTYLSMLKAISKGIKVVSGTVDDGNVKVKKFLGAIGELSESKEGISNFRCILSGGR